MEIQTVNVSVAGIYSKPRFSSEMVTQALLGEKMTVSRKEDNWLLIKQWDGYEGWIHEHYVVDLNSETEKLINDCQEIVVKELFNSVHESVSTSSPVLRDIVYGDILYCITKKDKWLEVVLPDGKKGWTILETKTPNYIDKRTAIVEEAKRFLGIQYLWGGKSPKGFDCSGFVQTVMKSVDILLPRDSSVQFEHSDFVEIESDNAQKGDLLFFRNKKNIVDHVAILVEQNDFIHCSGFVRFNSIIGHSKFYDNRLNKKQSTVKSINKYCQ